MLEMLSRLQWEGMLGWGLCEKQKVSYVVKEGAEVHA